MYILACMPICGFWKQQIESPAANREIILKMENEGPFVKYTTLENNHLYGNYCVSAYFNDIQL